MYMVRGAINQAQAGRRGCVVASKQMRYLIDKQSDQAEALNIGPSGRREVDRGVVVLAVLRICTEGSQRASIDSLQGCAKAFSLLQIIVQYKQ
jgi:hypothetical protein